MPAFGAADMLDADQIARPRPTSSASRHAVEGGAAALAEAASGLRRQLRLLPRRGRQGQRELGAPNLTDAIWLYGIREPIASRRSGARSTASCRPGPARLGDTTVKELASTSIRWAAASRSTAAQGAFAWTL
jgi:cytochrome c oxidase cbb3-type subunit 3